MDWIKFTEIKAAVNGLLSRRYPDYGIYGKEIKEGYETPAFFTEILDKGSIAETRNFARGGFTIKITYFQSVKNEYDQLKKADEIRELFGMVFRVGDRHLTVGEYSYDFIGEYTDILQVSVDIDYKENIEKESEIPVAMIVETKLTQG